MKDRPNSDIVRLGEAVHDALKAFVRDDPGNEHEIFEDLEGGCAVGAAALVQAAHDFLGIRADFVATDEHCWVEHDGYVYDPTATQFDPSADRVVVLSAEQAKKRHQYSRPVETRDIVVVDEEWPEGQRPKSFKVRWDDSGRATILWKGRGR